MGEISEDVVIGLQCEWCGVIFVKPHYHPVICKDCYLSATKKEREGKQKAYIKELGE